LTNQLTFTKFIFRHEIGDAYLGAVSRFMTNAFEYGDALLLPQESNGGGNSEGEKMSTARVESNQPYLNLATYVVNVSLKLICFF